MANETKTQKTRVTRTPVGGARDILTVHGKDPNFVYRWVIDSPGRIQRFVEGGYEVVQEDLEVGQKTVDRGSKLGSAVTKAGGSGQTLVLMRIPKEWYDEDQLAKQAQIDALEATMKSEAEQGNYGSVQISRRRPVG